MNTKSKAIHNQCAGAMSALLNGNWKSWEGLPEDCTLDALERLFGKSTVLDERYPLGRSLQTAKRSNLNDEPILVWHKQRKVLLLELDLLSNPLPIGKLPDAPTTKLDIYWGASKLEEGEWVIPSYGLSLIVGSYSTVFACRGFEPTDLGHYKEFLRPPDTQLKPAASNPKPKLVGVP